MKLFTVGPVEMEQSILELGGKQPPYFRTEEFSSIMLNVNSLMKSLVFTDKSSKLAILTSSGTGAMEAAVLNVFSSLDKVLIINGGGFGQRFSEICERYNIPFEELILNFGEQINEDLLERYDNRGFSGMLVNIHETSTGQLYPINLIANFCKRNKMLLVVDAISSFLADPYYMDLNSIDVTIISSNKGLAVSPGLAFVLVNKKTYEKIQDNPKLTFYFDLQKHFIDLERGQTPYTPAISVVMQVHERLKQVDEIGIERYLDLIQKRACYFRKYIDPSKYEIPKFPLSNMLTPVICKGSNAGGIYRKLKNDLNIFVNPIGGALEEKLLRIGHVGSFTDKDLDVLIEELNQIESW
ncbi:pyridoxal-phosphate-dependent aminotransferase family protein [Evansella halocellulosilytica]|uniref:pyridoxal-phosphate-dependent aminotransferase family protein n=1 Tax=Evansella halocellulosilytica TaxID=2011013 RepID=UPI000BB7EE11|nr:aminotransferase class V-fold PLP-dependent enzyme [Evansella halocellulosilytica]